jgi:glutathione S-transferase
MLELFIGNKNYSSWSLRPWILLKHFEIPFREHLLSVGGMTINPDIRNVAENGRVPALHEGDIRIWDSLAIAEYLAESMPSMWPKDRSDRARARSITAEMHSGFAALRKEFPMNLKLRVQGRPAPAEVQVDIQRIVAIWQSCREQHRDGPYLFGAFSIADAFYAPIVCRFETYNVEVPEKSAQYMATMLKHPAMMQWYEAARLESDSRAHYDAQTHSYGPSRP